MTIDNRLIVDFPNEPWDYGDAEDIIGFISDNYYTMMKIHRLIERELKKGDEKREEAHEQLQKLRVNEERWNRTKKFPKGFDEEEHEARKLHLTELREAEFDIIYKGKPLPYNKTTHLIMNKMWLFKMLDKADRKARGHIGSAASRVSRKVLWPIIKTWDLAAKGNESKKTKKFARSIVKKLRSIPKDVEERFTNV